MAAKRTFGGRWGSDRGLTPVLGTILLVALVLVLAAVLSSLALGFQGQLKDPAPQGGYTTTFHPDGVDNHGYPYFVLTFEGGPVSDASNIYIRDESGNEMTWEDVWTGGAELRAGDYIHIDGYQSDGVLDHVCEKGQRYTIIVRNDEGETLTMMTYEVPAEPNPPAGWC